MSLYNETQWDAIKNILEDLTCQLPVKSFSQSTVTVSTPASIRDTSDPGNKESSSGIRFLLKQPRYRGQKTMSIISSPEKFQCPKEERQLELEGQMVLAAAPSITNFKFEILNLSVSMYSTVLLIVISFF
ncbi:hypothetical protein WA026_006166 [Henosepilachna vigintioctopunctata]|uniref:Uncharacterized protein n=1 Tax=Henosepilachna vigintioctopunctata TaxID=420089 RepID=A0AAW1THY8_9CUCU